MAERLGIMPRANGRCSPRGPGNQFYYPPECAVESVSHSRFDPSAMDRPYHLCMAAVLVIEDEPVVTGLLRAVLRSEGYEVGEAATLRDAVAIAQTAKKRIDLVIVDHSLTDGGGEALFRELLEFQPAAKVLRISGHLHEFLIDQGSLRPEAAFLQKPFTPNQLREICRKLLHP